MYFTCHHATMDLVDNDALGEPHRKITTLGVQKYDNLCRPCCRRQVCPNLYGPKSGKENVQIIVSPVDFRRTDYTPDIDQPDWLHDLYFDLEKKLSQFPLATKP